MKTKNKDPPQKYKMPNGESGELQGLNSFSTHSGCYMENEDQKRRPCSNFPEMTRRPPKPLGMLCLATLRSAFYICEGSSFSTYRPKCVENGDPTVIHKIYLIDRFK